MKIIEVNTKKLEKQWLEVPVKIYKDDPNWIRPLDNDLQLVFDEKKNKSYRHGEAIRWILLNENNKGIGRVAAFYNSQTSKIKDLQVGGMGFFECINDQQAANLLFDKCKEWLLQKGMDAMDGPVNFGERDRWWGLLVDGFHPPTYGSNYNLPYYRLLFENYGFKIYFEQYFYYLKVHDPVPEKFREKAERISRNPDYHSEFLDKKKMEKYISDFLEIYNKAWANHAGIKKMRIEQARAIFKSFKPIMDEKLIWFSYYKDSPIAFFIMLPEINQIIKYLNGKMNLLGKIKFLILQKMMRIEKAFGVIFGVVPEQQGKGIEGFIIMSTAKVIQKQNQYKHLEMTWIGDFNPKMIKVVENLASSRYRTHITYRKIFDNSRTFERAPIIH